MSKSRRGYTEERPDGKKRWKFRNKKTSHVFKPKISKAAMDFESGEPRSRNESTNTNAGLTLC